jgi:hypothetical protein
MVVVGSTTEWNIIMSPQKHPASHRIGGPGASHESRRDPDKSKPHAEPSKREMKSGNAQKREQNKRLPGAHVNQQGNRANVRQNTTRQGHRRSA